MAGLTLGEGGLKVDLGCGPHKRDGFIGLDRYPQAGVDMVCDFDARLPLSDNSVSYVMACHSLEHCKDLMATMQELARVCQDRAIICIIAPYHNTGLNLANPYHLQVFNEHTARFWTTHYQAVGLAPERYWVPHVAHWGQGESDHSRLTMDLRLLRTEFFNFPQFVGLPEDEIDYYRRHWANVTDQMMQHLLVVKSPIEEAEQESFAQAIEEQAEPGCAVYQEPSYLTLRRTSDRQLAASRQGQPAVWHLSPAQQTQELARQR